MHTFCRGVGISVNILGLSKTDALVQFQRFFLVKGRPDSISTRVRFWHSWYRNIALSLLAHDWLAHIRQLEQEKVQEPMSLPG
jgi:hypothetical protein